MFSVRLVSLMKSRLIADNDMIETKADSIIDFSETNPFGMPE